MKLSTSLVAVKKIKSTVDSSKFSNDDLNQAAKLILEAEGVINPIIIQRISLEFYEVVDGDFEYYAAARAREIDPRKGEMIGAFLIEPENEEVIKEQIKVIRKQGFKDDHKPKDENSSQENLKNITDKVEQFTRDLKKIDSKHTNTQNKLEVLTDKVDIVNQAVERIEDILNKLLKTGFEQISPPSKSSEEDKMTVSQLKAKAKERKIKGYSKMNKNELIVALKEINAI